MRLLSAAAVLVLSASVASAFQRPPTVAPPSASEPVPTGPPAPSGVPPAPSETPTPSQMPAAPAAAASARVFGSEAGMIFSAVRPEKTADFELVMSRLRQALATSSDPMRQKQAVGWRIFKAAEPGPNATVLYVFVVDPVVKGADYGVAKVLAEAFPSEAIELYKLYNGALAGGQTLLNLTSLTAPPTKRVGNPGQAPAPRPTP